MIITAKYPQPDVLFKMVAKKSNKKDQKVDLKEAKGAEEGTTQEAQVKHGELHHECKENPD